MNVQYPKILIIGICFDTRDGTGITLTNLFKNWNSDKIAVATEDLTHVDTTICKHHYQLGYSENKRRFPFNLIQSKTKSGRVDDNRHSNTMVVSQNHHSYFNKIYLSLLHFSGLYHYARKLVISEEFERWVTEFNPDYIYTTAHDLYIIEFVKTIQQRTGAKVVTHIWDDLIKNYINKPGIFYPYWKRKTEREFKQLLNISKVRLSISALMASEYEKRYSKRFNTFHNCLELAELNLQSKASYNVNNKFIILYAGRLGVGISESLLDVCKSLALLKDNVYEFHIQTTTKHYILEELAQYEFVKIRPVVAYEEIPKILSSADLLLLPYDFDKHSIKCLKFSMATKAPEYMISGTPILLYASEQMYITQHAKANKWAYVVENNDIQEIATSIKTLSADKNLREKLGMSAKNFAIHNFDSKKVRMAFVNMLNSELYN